MTVFTAASASRLQGLDDVRPILLSQAALKTGWALAFGLTLSLLEAFSFQEDAFLYRFGFWTAMMLTWLVLFGLTDILSRATPLARLAPMLRFGACLLATALPISIIVHQVTDGLVPVNEPNELVERLWQSLLIGAVFETAWRAVLSALGAGGGEATAAPVPVLTPIASPVEARPEASPALMERLPFAVRAPILCLQMEDHYVRVHTSRGSALVLMRLSDAIAELDGLRGLKVHRSWWVAADALSTVERSARTARVRLSNGLSAPVSQPYLREVLDMAGAPHA